MVRVGEVGEGYKAKDSETRGDAARGTPHIQPGPFEDGGS